MESRPRVASRISFLLMLAALALLLPAARAEAAFAGNSGKIAFVTDRHEPNPSSCHLVGSTCNFEIYTINPDGTGETRLTNTPDRELDPAWSPDGQRIAYTKRNASGTTAEVWVMNADGTGQTQLNYWGQGPSWSPDGRKVAFGRVGHEGGLFVVNADGSGETMVVAGDSSNEVLQVAWSPDGRENAFEYLRQGPSRIDVFTADVPVDPADPVNLTQVTPNCCFNLDPDWAPDGTKISFSADGGSVNTINPDGTSEAALASGDDPAWSPDGRKIAYQACCPGPGGSKIFTMNADGSGQTQITSNFASDSDPHWQPLPSPLYARPRTATPTTVRLVPAYEPCGSSNASHGAPLSVPSCNPAQQTSDYATVGSPEANGLPANSAGHITMKVLTEKPIDLTNGDQSDVTFTGQITDVRDRQTLADYTGELRASFGLRLTDRMNGTDSVLFHPATAADASFGFSFGCEGILGSVGSTCSIATSADAAVPGITPEFKRAIWELGQVEVYDGGADGDGDTTGDNTLFMTQGLFAP